MSQNPTGAAPKSYVTALLLSFFLGVFGIDHTGLGIAKLLTGGGCGVWALIDFIMIATKSVKAADGSALV